MGGPFSRPYRALLGKMCALGSTKKVLVVRLDLNLPMQFLLGCGMFLG